MLQEIVGQKNKLSKKGQEAWSKLSQLQKKILKQLHQPLTLEERKVIHLWRKRTINSLSSEKKRKTEEAMERIGGSPLSRDHLKRFLLWTETGHLDFKSFAFENIRNTFETMGIQPPEVITIFSHPFHIWEGVDALIFSEAPILEQFFADKLRRALKNFRRALRELENRGLIVSMKLLGEMVIEPSQGEIKKEKVNRAALYFLDKDEAFQFLKEEFAYSIIEGYLFSKKKVEHFIIRGTYAEEWLKKLFKNKVKWRWRLSDLQWHTQNYEKIFEFLLRERKRLTPKAKVKIKVKVKKRERNR